MHDEKSMIKHSTTTSERISSNTIRTTRWWATWQRHITGTKKLNKRLCSLLFMNIIITYHSKQ